MVQRDQEHGWRPGLVLLFTLQEHLLSLLNDDLCWEFDVVCYIYFCEIQEMQAYMELKDVPLKPGGWRRLRSKLFRALVVHQPILSSFLFLTLTFDCLSLMSLFSIYTGITM